jgi:hypothetical protein
MSEQTEKIGPGNPPAEHRFKPGQSGNPGGRPKGESITSSLRKILEKEHNGKQIMELVAERLVKEALSGKFPFVKELLERTEGKVKEMHELQSQEHITLVVPAPRILSREELADIPRGVKVIQGVDPEAI